MVRTKQATVILSAFIIGSLFVYWFANDSFQMSGQILPSSNNGPMDSEKDGSVQVACKFPSFDPFHPDAMKFYEKHPTTTCKKGMTTLSYYDGEAVRVNQTLKKLKHGGREIKCWYRQVSYQRGVDFVNGNWKGPFTDHLLVHTRPEFVEVVCRTNEGETLSRMHHYITRDEYRKRSKAKAGTTGNHLNVILLGTDSVSSYLFRRAMPKTRRFLLETMDALEMNKYNKIADNTYPNLFTILVGNYPHELRNWSIIQGFDELTFLWDEFKAAGYRTQYTTDRCDFDDFKKAPTDSFNFPIAKALMVDKIAFNNNCFEDKVEVKLWLDLILEFAKDSVFNKQKFFSFGMMKRPTHDFPNEASAVDQHYANFFQELYDSNLLNNTFFVFFADHGPRTSAYRRTYLGSIEERAANMVIYVPPWFKTKYPMHHRNLVINQDRLTTNFDIHKTVKDVIKLDDENRQQQENHFKKSDSIPRALSLFTEVPPQRTCEDAKIDAQNCMCHGGVTFTNQKIMREIGEQVVKDINSLLRPVSSLCAPLRLKKATNLVLLQGYLGWTATYRVMLSTVPGDAAFEATVKYTVTAIFFTSIQTLSYVSRINTYRGQSDCVDDKTLKLYCYCKNLLYSTENVATKEH